MRFRARVHWEGRHFSGHLFVGVMLMLLGFLFLLDTLNIVDTGRFISRGWPVILIAIGTVKLLQAETHESRVGGFAWMLMGSLFLLSTLGVLPFSVWGIIWPTVLISFGLYLVVRRPSGTRAATDSASRFRTSAFMGGVERRIASQEFERAEITVLMGGVTLDFRDASVMDSEGKIDLFVVAGGVELFVPHDWTVINKVVPVMGAVEDKTRPPKESNKQLILTGLVLMGGVEVNN